MDWQPRKGEPSVRDEKAMKSRNWEGGMSLLSQVPSGRAASSSNRIDGRRLAMRLLSLAAACALSLLVPLKRGPCEPTAAMAKGKPKGNKGKRPASRPCRWPSC